MLFDQAFLERLINALGVLGVDRVVPMAARVLVSWLKEE